jgi:hypothetical protein
MRDVMVMHCTAYNTYLVHGTWLRLNVMLSSPCCHVVITLVFFAAGLRCLTTPGALVQLGQAYLGQQNC